jgi:hypothetical protein
MLSKITCLLFAVIFLIGTLNSQDTIRMKNGLTLIGYIIDVNKKEIKFQISGGFASLDNVLSYTKGGEAIRVNPDPEVPTGTTQISECERKNVGDCNFENKSDKSATVSIYAINTVAYTDTHNPLVATISIPPNGSAMAYDLIPGSHFFQYSFNDGGFTIGGGSGQIRITKCGVSKFIIK